MSKGSWKRPVQVSAEEYARNWDRVFSRSKKSRLTRMHVDGKVWSCPECGGQVQTKRGNVYTCNGCGAQYEAVR
jgi:NAD-dependent SIR2 family protein deacetylase